VDPSFPTIFFGDAIQEGDGKRFSGPVGMGERNQGSLDRGANSGAYDKRRRERKTDLRNMPNKTQ